MRGVAIIVPKVAPVAVPVAAPVAVLMTVVPVLATVDSELLDILVEILPIVVENTDGFESELLELLFGVLPILVENTVGVESGTVVPIDSIGNTLYCINAASIEFTPEFGELNVLMQILLLLVHVSWLVQHHLLVLESTQRS
jgi:hypothetical protein